MFPMNVAQSAARTIRRMGPDVRARIETEIDPHLEALPVEERLPWLEEKLRSTLVESGRYTETGARLILGKFPGKAERRFVLLRHFYGLVAVLRENGMLHVLPAR
jgi:hypothetical protein